MRGDKQTMGEEQPNMAQVYQLVPDHTLNQHLRLLLLDG